MFNSESKNIDDLLKILKLISKSIDEYLFLWDIKHNDHYFFGNNPDRFPMNFYGTKIKHINELYDLIYPDDLHIFREKINLVKNKKANKVNFNCRWISKDGSYKWYNHYGQVIYDNKGNPSYVIGIESNKRIMYLINSKSNLFNKNKFIMDIKNNVFENNPHYLLLISINNFYDIKYIYSEDYTDKIIKELINDIIKNQSIKMDNIYHLEDNIFAVLLNTSKKQTVTNFVNYILEINNYNLKYSFAAVYSDDIIAKKELIYDAAMETLLEAQKNKHSFLSFYSKEKMNEKIDIIEIEKEIEASVNNNFEGFFLVYQPQINSKTFELFGVETLLRFKSKTKGIISPNIFIPILEKSEDINKVGIWVLKEAMNQAKKWLSYYPNLHISINVSPIQLKDNHFINKILYNVNKCNFNPSLLTLEITESNPFMNTPIISNLFRYLKYYGIELSIDDFGTGYSNMKSLKTIKADEIKLDRIFITNIKEGSYNYNLIKNILNFSTLYIKRVVCEGVETVDELNTLNSLMDTIVQGFLFSKPLTIDEFFNTYCNKLAEEYIEYNLKLNNIKEKLKEVKYFNFNHPKFLRETNLGLWVLKVNLETNNYKMYIDDTSKVMFGLPDEIDPSKCFYLWADDFAKNNINIYDYVNELLNTKHMVDLECPWHHPKFGDVKIRMFGKLTEQDNNNITFKGYQRLLFNK